MMLHILLAQVPHATSAQIGDWLISAAAVAVMAAAIKSFIVRKPSIEAEFVTKAEHQADMETIKRDINSIRGKLDRDAEKILSRLDENKSELLLDGHRRSRELYGHIKELNTEIFTRIAANERAIARLDERTGQ